MAKPAPVRTNRKTSPSRGAAAGNCQPLAVQGTVGVLLAGAAAIRGGSGGAGAAAGGGFAAVLRSFELSFWQSTRMPARGGAAATPAWAGVERDMRRSSFRHTER